MPLAWALLQTISDIYSYIHVHWLELATCDMLSIFVLFVWEVKPMEQNNLV